MMPGSTGGIRLMKPEWDNKTMIIKHTMKKTIYILLALALVITGCKNTTEQNTEEMNANHAKAPNECF